MRAVVTGHIREHAIKIDLRRLSSQDMTLYTT